MLSFYVKLFIVTSYLLLLLPRRQKGQIHQTKRAKQKKQQCMATSKYVIPILSTSIQEICVLKLLQSLNEISLLFTKCFRRSQNSNLPKESNFASKKIW
jgi:hypothetical protein